MHPDLRWLAENVDAWPSDNVDLVWRNIEKQSISFGRSDDHVRQSWYFTRAEFEQAKKELKP